MYPGKHTGERKCKYTVKVDTYVLYIYVGVEGIPGYNR
jgi:hypothetical protein